MIIKRLTPDLSVMPQVSEADIGTLAKQGIKSIVGNRPEGESADQPKWTDLKAAALARGMEAVHIPVVANAISEEDIDAFREAFERLPKPIAAFCRTGTRAALLWALANNDGLTIDERIGVAARAGTDLEPFRARIQASSNARSSKTA